VTTKRCTKCGEDKPISEFYKRSASKDGLQNHCKPCSNERIARKRVNNREYMRSYMKSKAGKAAVRKHRLKKNYNLTPVEFQELLIAQNFCCASCGTTEPKGSSNQWHVDHCHDTGKVRGLLCILCNIGIGCLGDNLQGVRNALLYLEKHYNDNP